jgi:hypothetical protein
MSTRFLSLTWTTAVVAGLCALPAHGDDVSRLPSSAAQAYRLIVPAETETKWLRIPWMRDLAAAVEQAKQEKRPLLVWVSGDEPLERC